MGTTSGNGSRWIRLPDGRYGSLWTTTLGSYHIDDPASTFSGSGFRGFMTNSPVTYFYTVPHVVRMWGKAPAGNCNSYSFRIFTGFTGGSEIASGTFSSDSYSEAQLQYAGAFRIEISYHNAVGIIPASGTVIYYMAVGVQPMPQSIVHNIPSNLVVGQTVIVGGTSTSGLPVSFQVGSGSPVTLSGTTLQASDTGVATITASQSGGDSGGWTWSAANVISNVNIGPAPPLPVFSIAGALVALAGQPFSRQFSAANAPQSWSVSGFPSGVGIDPSGLLSGTINSPGSYTGTVLASNPGTTSVPMTIVVYTTPVISSANSANAQQGSPFSFNVTSSGGPWTFAAAGLPAGLSIHPATGVISGIAMEHGVFDVALTAANAFVGTSTLTLSVAGSVAPGFTLQPQGSTVAVGQVATFKSAAIGSPAPAYQWKRNGVAIPGATSASYNIGSVQMEDAGNYTVLASNIAGNVTSTSAVLTVTAATVAPAIATQPANQTVTEGRSVGFSVVATGSPLPTYQWRKDGNAIPGATGRAYIIPAANTGHSGGYAVSVSNSAGTVTSNTALLTVTASSVATDTDGDGVADTVEAALGTSASAAAEAGSNTVELKIQRPPQ